MIALNSGNRTIHELMISQSHQQNSTKSKIINIIDRANQLKLEIKYLPKDKIEKYARNQPHQGIILKCNELPFIRINNPSQLLKEEKKKGLIWVFLDQITDPQNFGALIRTTFFLGIDGIIVNEINKCPLNSTVSKTSSGAVELMEINSVQQPTQFLKDCKAQNWIIIGTGIKEINHNKIKNIELNTLHLQKEENIIIIFGSEGNGISPSIGLECDTSVVIQSGQHQKFPHSLVDSLNVSVSAGIVLSKLKSFQQK